MTSSDGKNESATRLRRRIIPSASAVHRADRLMSSASTLSRLSALVPRSISKTFFVWPAFTAALSSGCSAWACRLASAKHEKIEI